jgi:thioesterase-3
MIFTTDIKIRGFHCDTYGHVNNARWIELLEEVRWRWLDGDIDHDAWAGQRQGIAVISIKIQYRRPAHAHDLVEFRCWISKLGGRSAVCRQEAVRKATGERLVEADVTILLFDIESGRPRPMAGDACETFTKYLHGEATA